jgi:hypothetical protein
VVIRLAWVLLVLVALVLMVVGLWGAIYFEPTSEAIAAERRGQLLVILACVLLGGAAIVAHVNFRAPVWAVGAVAAPIVICGGLAVTGIPGILGVVVAYPLALAGMFGSLLVSR